MVAEFIYYDRIIPNANENYALLAKCWNVVERFLTFGFCPTYAPFVEHAGYFCPDLRLPYWGDIFIQPGKLSDEDSSYIFMRSWWQTSDIDALIDSQSKLGKDVAKTWDVEALKKVKDLVTTKDEKAKTPSEREKNINTQGGIELITGFQRGKGAKFYTFHVSSTGTGKGQKFTGTIVRTKINKDPRGDLPVSFAYGDIDGFNPFGRGIIELVLGMQNLMDAETQMYQYNRALQLNPPLLKKGNFSKNKIKYAPNTIIDLGSNPDASIEPLKIDTTALQNFPNNFGLMKSTLLNLLSSPDTSISAEIGNPGFSKTPQGVESSKANLSIDDNYVRKQFETWFERWSETAINLYFAERTGVEELQLDKKTVEKLLKLAEKGKFDMTLVSDDNKIRINYDTATEQLKFEVDASTSKMADEIKQLESYKGLIDLIDKSPALQDFLPPEKKKALWNAIVANSGAEDQEKLTVSDDELQKMMQEKQQQPPPRENVFVNYKDAPEDIKRQIEQADGFQPSQQVSPVQQSIDAKNQPAPATEPDNPITPDHVLKADQQAHDQVLEKAKLAMDAEAQAHDQNLSKAQLIQQTQQAKQQPTGATSGK